MNDKDSPKPLKAEITIYSELLVVGDPNYGYGRQINVAEDAFQDLGPEDFDRMVERRLDINLSMIKSELMKRLKERYTKFKGYKQ